MQIEVVEFEFGMTANVGDYSNVRPSLIRNGQSVEVEPEEEEEDGWDEWDEEEEEEDD